MVTISIIFTRKHQEIIFNCTDEREEISTPLSGSIEKIPW